ncbi:MAG: hypothetical protein JW720_05265 [Sedimentisphaerales bacterium]|nr:hypothetical protein [Sedimentisphaerales bacterium]
MRRTGQNTKCMMIAVVIGLMSGIACQAAGKPLKVFILAGQSNMEGNVNVSTFDFMADDPNTAPLLKEMVGPDGKPVVCDHAWISYLTGDNNFEITGKLTAGYGSMWGLDPKKPGDKIGPEFTFGVYMSKAVKKPFLIIKTAWGGKSLRTDFRPPSAGPYVLNDYERSQFKQRADELEKYKTDKAKATGIYYRLMIEHVKKVLADIKRVVPDYDPKQGYELAGFLWFQGWNDYCDGWGYPDKPGKYDDYSQLMAQFIRDVRKDLSAPKMPFVIGVLGVGGIAQDDKSAMAVFRQAQAAPASLPEFRGSVTAVPTAPFWDSRLDELHRRMDVNWPKVDKRAAEEFKKHPNMSGDEQWAFKMKVMAENFTPEEWRHAQNISHWDCHYHGAAKIMAPIGKAFAEAMVKLQ